jgi:hypothetical protein
VNRLISDHVPFDFISRFVFNKPSFYGDYENWSEGLKEHVVKTVTNTYLRNKENLREDLYGFDED